MSEALKLSSNAKKEPVLCVDLDHTLSKTDTSLELLMQFVTARPQNIFRFFAWILRGRAYAKDQLAKETVFDAARIPFNEELLSFLRKEQARGRRIVLVTGAPRATAQAVANHLRLFTESYGSRVDVNLVGKNKEQFLINKYGVKNFDYVGDSRADLEVWRSAANAIFVGSSPRLLRKVQKTTNVSLIVPRPALKPKVFIRAIRAHQWLKNILILLPIIFAHRFREIDALVSASLGFLSFCFTASAIYIINDLIDLKDDRVHPDKKSRPFASGDLSVAWVVVLIPLLFVLAFICSAFLPDSFRLVLLGYVALTTAYTVWLKQVAIADIVVLATLFCGRLFAGSAASQITLSPWLLAFTGFFFLSLALVKRCSELLMLQGLNKSETPGRGYVVQDIRLLISLGISAGYLSVLVLALYLNSENAKLLYVNKDALWATCPVALYWLSRVWLLTNRGEMHSDPITFALKDKISWLLVGVVFLCWLYAHGLKL